MCLMIPVLASCDRARRRVQQRPAVVLDALALVAFRFSGECPGPRESTAVRLIRPDDLLGHLGVQDRPRVSTAVVSTALAADDRVQDRVEGSSDYQLRNERSIGPDQLVRK